MNEKPPPGDRRGLFALIAKLGVSSFAPIVEEIKEFLMLVPKYWAESTHRGPLPRRRKAIHRYGWSDDSQEAAQAHAEQRVREAVERLENTEIKVPWQEGQCRYGEEVRPICEEIIERRDPDVVTRNSYGALCLNTPDVLFADVDCQTPEPPKAKRWLLKPVLIMIMMICFFMSILGAPLKTILLVISLPLLVLVLCLEEVVREKSRLHKHELSAAAARVKLLEKLRTHLSTLHGRFRLYETPNGFRIAAEHALFDPAGEEAKHIFDQLGTDRHFVFLCHLQRCFRARVTAKPWRCGVTALGRYQRVDWAGVRGQSESKRQAWLVKYEKASKGYAACRLIGRYGQFTADPRAKAVLDWHDELARANSQLPLA